MKAPMTEMHIASAPREVGGTILYSVDQSNWTTENPSYVDVSSNADQKYPV